jgi:hypothetical protein
LPGLKISDKSPQDVSEAIKEVRQILEAFYEKIGFNPLVPMNVDEMIEFANLVMRAVGAAA